MGMSIEMRPAGLGLRQRQVLVCKAMGSRVQKSMTCSLEAWGHLNKEGKVWEAESLHQLQRAEEILNPAIQMRGIFFHLFRQKKEAEAKQESMQCLQRESGG